MAKKLDSKHANVVVVIVEIFLDKYRNIYKTYHTLLALENVLSTLKLKMKGQLLKTELI